MAQRVTADDGAVQEVADRLIALWNHLGLEAAYVAAQMPGDVAGLVARAPTRIAGLAFCVPTRLDPQAFVPLAQRVLLIGAERGLSAEVCERGAAMLPRARRVVLANYDAPGWADVMAERGEAVVAALTTAFTQADATRTPTGLAGRAGVHAGITWRAIGDGPPLVLLPFFLAPSQWAPALAALARRFTVILLGGRFLGGVAALEDRAAAASYRAMVDALWQAMEVSACRRVLDVGCGSGALDRLLAPRLAPEARIVAIDLNRSLLTEARALAQEAGVAARIDFLLASAEALPLPDASCDAAFSITVLEECDADRALRELVRVVRPGGRIGVIVRAIDLPQFWHLDLPEPVRRKVTTPPQSVGASGVADAGLYRRMRRAGLDPVHGFPALVTLDRPGGPIWRYREDHALSLLDPAETTVWRQAVADARREGLLFQAHPMHCAVGHRPG
jgi:SAM-dependent methyltransferase